METCSKCIITDNYPQIEIEDGICSFCKLNNNRLTPNRNISREEEFYDLLKSDAENNKYDCIVPISGGKDSTYILYYLVKKMAVKPLAVFFNNGFATDYAKKNVEDICKKLNVDLITTHATKYRKKLVQEAWYISYYTGNIFNFCGNCENNIRTIAINEALRHDIKYIIWGSTDYEDSPTSFLNPNSGRFRDSYSKGRHVILSFRLLFKSIGELIFNKQLSIKTKYQVIIHRLKYKYYFVMDNIKIGAPAGLKKFSPFLQLSFNNQQTKTVYFYDYIPYDPFKQITILKHEIGWNAPIDREAKMDCILHNLQNYKSYINTGITDTGFKLSVLIRNSMISRDDALLKESSEIEYLKDYFKSDGLDLRAALNAIKGTIFY